MEPYAPKPPSAGITDMSHRQDLYHACFFFSSLSIFHLYSVDFEDMEYVGMEGRLSLPCIVWYVLNMCTLWNG